MTIIVIIIKIIIKIITISVFINLFDCFAADPDSTITVICTSLGASVRWNEIPVEGMWVYEINGTITKLVVVLKRVHDVR